MSHDLENYVYIYICTMTISVCIRKKKMKFILLLVFFVYASASRYRRQINWNPDNWAFACDFQGNDLSNVRIRGEDCGRRCSQTAHCTHFTWTGHEGGTCWMKTGEISRDNAHYTGDHSMVCGIANRIGDKYKKLYNVLATRHDAHEAGACELPPSNYAVSHPLALGTIYSLVHLRFTPDLCVHILEIACGHAVLSVIVMNSNIGGGLDLYKSSWSQLTNNQPPGQAWCSVQLSDRNAFNFDGPRCFYKPGTDFGNAYYHNVGLLNTKGRLVVRATIDNRPGEHRGDNPYFAFDFGPIYDNKEVVFTYDDGNTETVYLRDCEYQQNNKLWF